MFYQIKKDEKITDIIRFFDVPFEVIQGYNSFVKAEDHVYENEVLTLPMTYVVQPDETYEHISKKFFQNHHEFSILNNHLGDQHVIYPGQTILIPPYRYEG